VARPQGRRTEAGVLVSTPTISSIGRKEIEISERAVCGTNWGTSKTRRMSQPEFQKMLERLDIMENRCQTAVVLLGMARCQLTRQTESIRSSRAELLLLLQRPPPETGVDPGKG
jgi:hypothetical protein